MSVTKKDTKTSRWDLFGCAISGHETYKPVGSAMATQLAGQLSVTTTQGESWRCLRCGTYVLGKPRYSSSLSKAPLVVRGSVLRQILLLRFLAVERGVRAILLIGVGFLILHFKSNQGSLQKLLDGDIPALRSIAHSIGYNLDASKTFHTIQHGLSLGAHTLNVVAIVIFAYAAILSAEAVGLWLIKRWGEYFSAVATAAFIPLEIYELIEKTSILKIGTLTINIAAVLYLLITKRLFGIRGGGRAYEASLEGDNLLEITKKGAPRATT